MLGSFVLIVGAVVLGVAGETLLKSGMNQVGDLALNSAGALAQTTWQVMTTPAIIVGFACYGLAAVMWLLVLSKLDLSYAYPMLALTYVLVPLSARLFLHESVPTGRWVGILMIVAGIAVAARFTQPE